LQDAEGFKERSKKYISLIKQSDQATIEIAVKGIKEMLSYKDN